MKRTERWSLPFLVERKRTPQLEFVRLSPRYTGCSLVLVCFPHTDGRRVSSLSTAAFSMLKSKRKSDAAPRVPDMPEDVSLDGSDAGSGGSAD